MGAVIGPPSVRCEPVAFDLGPFTRAQRGLADVAARPPDDYDGAVTPNRRPAIVAALFAIALAFVALAAITHRVYPLFVAWLPLLTVPWLLTRPE
jgi:hypothetical protein